VASFLNGLFYNVLFYTSYFIPVAKMYSRYPDLYRTVLYSAMLEKLFADSVYVEYKAMPPEHKRD
jgi:hypothetical protein